MNRQRQSGLAKQTINKVLLIVWGVLLISLSFYNPSWFQLEIPFPNPDKYKHLIGAFVFGFLLFGAFNIKSYYRLFLFWIIASVLVEVIQYLFTNGQRAFSIMDIVANIAGFGLGNLVARLKLRVRKYS